MSESTQKAKEGSARTNWEDVSQGSGRFTEFEEEQFHRGLGDGRRASSRASNRASTISYEARDRQMRRRNHQSKQTSDSPKQTINAISRPAPSSRSSQSKPSRASSGQGLKSQGFISHQEFSSTGGRQHSSSTGGGQAYRSERKSDSPKASSRANAGSARSSSHRTSAHRSSQPRSSHSSRSPRAHQSRAPRSSSPRRSSNRHMSNAGGRGGDVPPPNHVDSLSHHRPVEEELTELAQHLKQLDAERSIIQQRFDICKFRDELHSVKDHAASFDLHLKLTNLPSSMTFLEALEHMCQAADSKYDETFGYFDEDRDESPTEGYDIEHSTDKPAPRPDSEGDMLDDQPSSCDDERVVATEYSIDDSAGGPDSEGDLLDDQRSYCDDQQSINSGPTARDGGRGETEEDNDEEHFFDSSASETDSEGAGSDEDLMHDNAEPSVNPGDADDALPEGWSQVTDPKSNKVYYYNSQTNHATWSRPVKPTDFEQELEEIGNRLFRRKRQRTNKYTTEMRNRLRYHDHKLDLN